MDFGFALTSAMDDLDPFDALAASLSSARAAIRGAGAHEADLVRRHLLDAAASLRAAPGGHLRLRSAHFARSYASFARFLLLHVAVEWLPCFGAEDRRRCFAVFFSAPEVPFVRVFAVLAEVLAMAPMVVEPPSGRRRGGRGGHGSGSSGGGGGGAGGAGGEANGGQGEGGGEGEGDPEDELVDRCSIECVLEFLAPYAAVPTRNKRGRRAGEGAEGKEGEQGSMGGPQGGRVGDKVGAVNTVGTTGGGMRQLIGETGHLLRKGESSSSSSSSAGEGSR